MKFKYYFLLLFIITNSLYSQSKPPIYIAFHWHMHQPIYYPYESIVQTQQNARFSYNLYDVFNQRTGPYTSWPKNAITLGESEGFEHLGAQISFSGSLIENLNNLEANGNSNFVNWKSSWNSARNSNTSLGNPRMDIVGFGYHHPLMGLIDYEDIRKQIQQHKDILSKNFIGSYSNGIFPPENAFSPRMIPALVDEGLQWVMVDNIHFERNCKNYPFSTSANLYEANPADIQNADPNDWIGLNGLWCPSKVSAAWAHKPHFVEYTDPNNGKKYRMIAVPTSRYLGNEDGRGGFGALQYEAVMSQLEPYNNDPNHPILIVLHHDGDNYGGGSSGYYGSNFQSFVSWLKTNSVRFVCTTVQDYLQMFPPDQNDVIAVEDGSWSGADNGDPEFKKWNGDPSDGYSPDRNSWGVITAAKNIVLTSENISPSDDNTKLAWKYFTNAETSCYWYWEGTTDATIWDANPTRACNLAVEAASKVSGTDITAPTIYIPQREPYNPGGYEWKILQSSDFKIWTYVYDKNGLKTVKLRYRTRKDTLSNISDDNRTYNGGINVDQWSEIDMTSKTIVSKTIVQPTFKADEYSAEIKGIKNHIVDYYVEAIDNNNNVRKSPIQHVWVGDGKGTSGGNSGSGTVKWEPKNPNKKDTITIKVASGISAKLHWGVNDWLLPSQVYQPSGSVVYSDGKSVETLFNQNKTGDTLIVKIGPFNNSSQGIAKVNFVIHYDNNSWDNNNGSDYIINIADGTVNPPSNNFVMDGIIDNSVPKVSSYNGQDLYAEIKNGQLYLATQSAKSQNGDIFIFLSDTLPNSMVIAPWSKAGQVASYKFFLANESTNNYSTWSVSGNAYNKFAGDNYIEGTVDLNSAFGRIPQNIYMAIGKYATNDNGVLFNQIPQGNANTDIETNEYYTFNTTTGLSKNNINKPQFDLLQNYPNPFNPATVITYSISKSSNVSLKIYDMLGREISTLVNERQNTGNYSVRFNGSNLPSGMYIARISNEYFSKTIKMQLIK